MRTEFRELGRGLRVWHRFKVYSRGGGSPLEGPKLESEVLYLALLSLALERLEGLSLIRVPSPTTSPP